MRVAFGVSVCFFAICLASPGFAGDNFSRFFVFQFVTPKKGDRMSELEDLAQAASTPRTSSRRRPQRRSRQVTTIELTGKKWKAMSLVAGLLVGLGIAAAIGGLVWAAKTADPRGALLTMIGLIGFGVGTVLGMVSQIGAWWNHG